MKCTEQSFLKDVANHQMTIMRDDGVYRHIRFKQPGTNEMYFDLVTWPGWLCYSGDMGTYVFQRHEDMFEFFRRPQRFLPPHPRSGDPVLRINLGYWSEKVQAEERREGVEQYSAEKFSARIKEWLDDAEASDEIREAVEDEVLSSADDGEQEARRAVDEFDRHGFRFQDFQEVDLTEYTYRFIWCCYALVWGIQKYDQARKAMKAGEVPEHRKTCRACANCGLEPDSPYFICGAKFAGPMGLHIKQEPLSECSWNYFVQHPLRNPDGSLKCINKS